MVQKYAPLTYFKGRRQGMYFVKHQRAPLSTDIGEKLGCVWLDIVGKKAYIIESNANGAAQWEQIGGGLYFQEAVLSKVTAQAGAVQTEGNRYISPAAGATWAEDNIYEWHAGAWVETVAAEGMAVFIDDVDEFDLFDGTDWNNLVSPVTTFAGLSDTDINDTVPYADAQIVVYDAVSTKWENHAMTGDIVITNAGVTSFNGSPIVNADINAGAAIAYSKLAALTSANILVGSAGNVATVTALTGDVAITNLGLTTVTDLTMAGELIGNILYYDGANWTVLANGAAGLSLLSGGVGVIPYYGVPAIAAATSIANNATLNDAGALDAILSFTTQTVAAPTLTVPDFAGVSDTFVFRVLAQTLTNKTLTSPIVNTPNIDGGTVNNITSFGIRSSGAAFDLEFATTEALGANRILSWNVGDAARSITLGGNIALGGTLTTLGAWTQVGAFTLEFTTTAATAVTLPTTGTLATIAGIETLTNKTLTTPDINGGTADALTSLSIRSTGAAFDLTFETAEALGASKKIAWNVADTDRTITLAGNIALGGTLTTLGAWTQVGAFTMQLTTTGATAITLPTAGTLATLAGVEVFTNKSYDCNGAGNVLTNANMAEMEAQTIPPLDSNNVTVVDGLIIARVTNNATNFNIYNANAPYAFIVCDAWSVNTSADGGTWKLNNGAAGAGTDITNVVTCAASDNDVDRVTSIVDAAYAIAAGGSLSVVLDGGGALDCLIFIKIAKLS